MQSQNSEMSQLTLGQGKTFQVEKMSEAKCTDNLLEMVRKAYDH